MAGESRDRLIDAVCEVQLASEQVVEQPFRKASSGHENEFGQASRIFRIGRDFIDGREYVRDQIEGEAMWVRNRIVGR